MQAKNTLTSKDYWEKYYAHNHAKREHIIHVCSAYDIYWDKLFKNVDATKILIEIGGYPGRFLAYLSSKYKIQPTCLDYNTDSQQIENCFKVMGVEQFNIIEKDFTTYTPVESFDYVISNGFIEHFENYDEILDLHMKYLKPNGRLLVMIPNMKGYIRFYKYLVDYQNLKIHNLKSMRLSVFRNFAKRHDLQIEHLSYFGTFPLNVHQKLNFLQKVIYKGHRLIFKNRLNKIVEKYPSPYFSSGIISIFQVK